jgi:hypothetical protein
MGNSNHLHGEIGAYERVQVWQGEVQRAQRDASLRQEVSNGRDKRAQPLHAVASLQGDGLGALDGDVPAGPDGLVLAR